MKIHHLFLAITLLAIAPSYADVLLVENGEPRATIVVAPDDPKADLAASELRKYLAQMSGAELPLVREGEPVGTPSAILVGHTAEAKKLGIKVPSGFNPAIRPDAFEEEGFVIKTVGDRIVVGGNSDGPYQGTIYAAYEFLERLGCRFYFPGEWGEMVPELPTVLFPETDLGSKPDFALRNVSLGGWFPTTPGEREAYAAWERKIKMTPSGSPFYPLVGDGFLGYLLPPDEFPDEPELYAMNKQGSREQPEKFLNGVMLSLHNPRVLELSIKNLRAAFAGETDSKIKRIVQPHGFGISPPDGAAFDYDPDSGNQNFDYPSYLDHPMTSEEFFGFAAKLAREFPNKWVATMAYSGREMPPQGVEIPPNMTVMYAPISTSVLHPPGDPNCWRSRETLMLMQQWCRRCDHVYLYDYNPGFLLGHFVPEADVRNFTVAAPLYKEMGLKGFKAEGRKAFMITWISYYIRSRLMWDAEADVELIKAEFYSKFFGPGAGPLVQQWWEACEEALAASDKMLAHEDWLIDHIYNVEFTDSIRPLVERAAKEHMTSDQRERFEAFQLIAENLDLYAKRNEAEKNLDYAAAIGHAERMEKIRTELMAIDPFFIGDKSHPDFNNGWMKHFAVYQGMTDGTGGTLLAPVPLEAKFTKDEFNEGVIAEWYLTDYDDSDWGTMNTFHSWEAQMEPLTPDGRDYNGYGWYRFEVDVPPAAAENPARLRLNGVMNEGWVWINGHYAGHRPWKLWWAGREPLEMEVDATGKLQPGKNSITVRVLNTAEHGGLLRRGFLYAPKE